jgi:RES domain-containing protein
MSKAKPTDPPEVIELFEAIAERYANAGGFNGIIVRSVATKYANKNDFFSGEGAAKSGGRWNQPGISVIYASLDPVTTTHEAYQNIDAFGFPITAIQPRVIAGAKATFGKVLDLTDAKVRATIGFSLKELVEED